MGWAAEQAKKITEAEESLRKDREWELHRATVVKSEGPKVFGALVSNIDSSIKEFNTARGSSELRCECSPDRIEIVKESRPSMLLRLCLIDNPTSVSMYKRTSASLYDVTELRRTMYFGLSREGEINLDGSYDLVGLTQNLLGEIFHSFRPQG